MPTIRVTDNLGLNLSIPVQSPLSKYIRNELLNLLANPPFRNELQKTLGETGIQPFGIGLDFKEKAELGTGGPELVIEAGGDARIAIHKPGAVLFGGDLIGGPVSVPDGHAYVSGSLSSRLQPGITREAGDITFGFQGNSEVKLESYQCFPIGDTVETAFTTALRQFAVPGDLDDLEGLPPQAVCCASGSGSLAISTALEIATAPNPLAIPGLPPAAPAIQVKPGGSVEVSASFTISGAYELRVRKLDEQTIRLGYHKRDQTEFEVGVDARAGITGGAGGQDWIAALLAAVSGNPQADTDELARAGVSPEHIEEIQDGIRAGVERSLAASCRAGLSRLQAGEAAFLYDVDLGALTTEGRRAINAALDGDLSLLHSAEGTGGLQGIVLRRSVLKEARETGLTLRVNLLGILNSVSISKLMIEGSVTTDPQTGEVTITDTATAKRLRALMLNYGENQTKLRRLFFEAMVATVTYRASKMVQSIAVSSAHTYFELHHKTGKQDMKDNLDALEAVGLIGEGEKQSRLSAAERFGHSTFLLEAAYDDGQCERLFFDEEGKPRQPEFYEAAAREALAALVTADDPDFQRRLPAVDEELWSEMKRLGARDAIIRLLQGRLRPNPPPPLLAAIDGDFAFIAAFWSKALHKTARKLAEVRTFLVANPGLDPDDNRLQKLRKDLAKHLGEVASDTKEHFGDPLGLVAMYYAAGRSATVSANVRCAVFSLELPNTVPAGA